MGNCAVDPEWKWCAGKKAWCCRIHHLGCPTNTPTLPPPVPDPYNCEDGFANWQAGWSVAKKAWCCRHHSKGCPGGAVAGRRSHPMIATPASRIGKQVGLWPRRRGVASTRARAARLQAVVRRLREDCIELKIGSRYFALTSVPSSGALDLECVEG